MRKMFILLIAAIWLTCTQCSESATITPNPEQQQKEYKQPQLKNGNLKVLAIGNSFIDDPMAYFNSIVVASGIDRSHLCVYSAVISGASLKNWWDKYDSRDNVKITRRCGFLTMPVTEAPLKELLSQDWDIVTLQQVSTQSTEAKTFHPYLENLVSSIHGLCTNPDVLIGWQLVWSYGDLSINDGVDEWLKMCLTLQAECNPYIDFVIPTGTAIQNARATSLNTPHGLTRDGKHLGYGAGRYIAACTWYQSLLAPAFGVSVLGNSAVHEITENERSSSRYETIAVTSTNNTLCQQCVVAAVENPFQLTFIE